jgi:FlaA1/EpsC-like NDP-sugar epimerase
MILRFFNKDLPISNFIFVFGEGVLIYTTILVSAFLCNGAADASFLSLGVLAKALVIMAVCLTSIYLNDLYQLRVTDTYLELGCRLASAMGVASIILSLMYYCAPSLLVGRGIVIISILFLIVVGISWRYAYNYILKRKMFTEKVLLLGSGELCLKILDELSNRRDCGYQVTGLETTNSDSTLNVPHEIPVFSVEQGLFKLVDFLKESRFLRVNLFMKNWQASYW